MVSRGFGHRVRPTFKGARTPIASPTFAEIPQTHFRKRCNSAGRQRLSARATPQFGEIPQTHFRKRCNPIGRQRLSARATPQFGEIP